MPSFDIVSKVDRQELDNALNQARKEISQRYDFKGTDAAIESSEKGLILKANSEGRVDAIWEVLLGRLVRRGLAPEAFTRGKHEAVGTRGARQTISIQEGIPEDAAKKITKLIKGSKLKVQAAIQGDVVRITGKKRDDLQAAMQLLKGEQLEIAMQFVNFRD
ncbi:MAG: YajQ family cyclic di-GMP-binding protein [Deltaproteobacteria bacterium]|nr:YajQ family cyclic di-GMP-binding protein [Deltaproteobacteria bacterium]